MRWIVFAMALIGGWAVASDLSFSVYPKQLGQGQTALLRVSAPVLPSDLTASIGSQGIAFWDCGSADKPSRCGVIAAPLDTPVGRMKVRVSWTEGAAQSEELAVTVRKGKFKINKLTVDPSITKPSEEEQKRIAQDKLDIEAAYANPEKNPLWEGGFDLPTSGGITSLFGNQRTYNGQLKSTHFGVDLRADTTTAIHATNSGKVLLAKAFFMAGNMVLLDHGNGIYSSYAHLSEIKVTPGQPVKKGELLGVAGATGRVTGPHLHWAMRANGVPVDPHALRSTLNRVLAPDTGHAVARKPSKHRR